MFLGRGACITAASLACILACQGGRAAAQNLPTGGTVSHGSVAITQPSATSLTINQSSPTGIIGWQSFSIGQGNQVQFNNGSGATLNRVTGNVPSSLNGVLSATGSVYLVNPAGIAVGPNGRVNTGGSFVASTLDITDRNFLAGGNLTFSGDSQAGVINLGKIGSSKGDILLIARTVENGGSLRAPNGTAAMASGSEVVITDGSLADGKVLVRLPANNGTVRNTGRVRAAAVELRANGGNVYALAGNTGSVIKATGVAKKGGRIFLTAEGGSVTATQRIVARRVVRPTQVARQPKTATRTAHNKTSTGGDIVISGDQVTVGGMIDARGRNGGAGGTIILTGTDVTLGLSALLDASGKTGGTILIGGDRAGGSDPSIKFVTQPVANAETTTIVAGATIRANGSDGNGGNIVVWSNGATSVAGTLSAKGQGGGFIETSGHTLTVSGAHVDAGQGGKWLLDPYDLTVDSATAITISGTLNGGTDVSLMTSATGTFGPGIPNPSGNGDIIVAASITWSTPATLTLSAYRDISFNAGAVLTATSSGNVILRADNTGTGTGTLQFANSVPQVLANGGSVAIFYNPTGDSGSVNGTKYTAATQTDFSPAGGNHVAVSGGGTLTTYMLVNTVYDLQNINNNLSATYALGRDIDASATAAWSPGFVPLGTDGASNILNSGNGFAGTFDGQSNVISGLTINRPLANYVGLFGYSTGTIRNVGLEGGAITGQAVVGGLVGYNFGTVQQSYAAGTVTGSDSFVGGLVGANDGNGTVRQSYATGAVTGTESVGGLIGANTDFATVQQSYATGAVTGSGQSIGGLVGTNFGTIQQSYATGAVTGSDSYVGGLIGTNTNGGTVRQSYATGAVTGTDYVGGLVGRNYSFSTVEQSYASGAVNGSGANVGGLVGASEISATVESSYWDVFTTGRGIGVGSNLGFGTNVNPVTSNPALSADPTYAYKQSAYANFSPGFTTTPGAPGWFMIEGQTRPFGAWEYSTTIRNSHQLQLVNMDLNASYKLGRNIDLGPNLAAVGGQYPGMWTSAGFVPIGTDGAGTVQNSGNGFAGTFDGQSKVIGNLTINRPSASYVGLFGYSSGTIQNVGLEGGAVTGGSSYVGGLVGSNNGGTVQQSYATGAVNGGAVVGGLVGYVDGGGTVRQSYAIGAVTGTGDYVGGLVGFSIGAVDQSYAAGAVIGNAAVGGLVGFNSIGATVQQSYATGAVIGNNRVGGLVGENDVGTVQQSYATGAVIGNDSVGGLVGWNIGGTVQQSYATGAVIGRSAVGGLVGLNDTGGTVTQTYSTGAVTGTTNVGGLVGQNNTTVTASYWDTQTSGTTVGIGGGTLTGATGLTSAQFRTAANFVGWNFGTTPGGSGWVIVNGDGTFNNAGGAAGATRPFLLNEYTTKVVNTHQLQLVALAPSAAYTLGASIEAARDFAPMTGQYIGGPLYPGMWDASGFVPIGTFSTPFTGSFNGQGNYIAGLTINRPQSDHVGLFGVIGSLGTVSNLGLIDATVTGQNNVGALAGTNGGTITNAYAIGPGFNFFTGTSIGTVTGNINVGGLVGFNTGTIASSYTGNEADGANRLGGLVGYNNGSISLAYSTSTVFDNTSAGNATEVGGLVGFNNGTITQAWASGFVDVGFGATAVGGLVGRNSATGTITQSYWDSDTTAASVGVGADGNAGNTQLTALTNAQAFTQASYPDFNFSTNWYMIDGQTRPFLRSEFNTSVATPHQLQLMSMDLTARYTLARDIDLGTALANPSEMWSFGSSFFSGSFVPVGITIDANTQASVVTGNGFTGSLNGQYNVVKGLYIERDATDYVGLFGVIGAGGSVSQVGLEGGNVFGSSYVGSLAGQNRGTITQSSSSVNVFGSLDYVGGLVGQNGLFVCPCTSLPGSIAQSFATGLVSGSSQVGGLVGDNTPGSTIIQAYATGAVAGQNFNVGGLAGSNSGLIAQAYALGSVAGDDFVGGLVGSNIFGSITQTYATGAVTAFTGPNIGGLVGDNTNGVVAGSHWDSFTTGQNSGVGPNAGTFGASAVTSDPTLSGDPSYAYKPGAYSFNFAPGNSASGWFMIDGQTRPFGQWEYSTTIRNPHQLQLVSMDLGARYTLGRNIDLTGVFDPDGNGNYPGMWTAAGFVPIGNIATSFTGSLNGQNKIISGLVIDRPLESNVGLFGSIGAAGVVRDLGIINAAVIGGDNVGTLAGSNAGIIVNSYETFASCGCGIGVGGGANVGGLVGDSSGIIAFSHSDVEAAGLTSVGGLVGSLSGGFVANSYATGAVIGDPTNSGTGGLTGVTYAGAAVTRSYATGPVYGGASVGGLIGDNSATVTESYAAGNVSGNFMIGGLIGANQTIGSVLRSYATGSVAGDASSVFVGGLIGFNDGTVTDAYATGAVRGGDFVGGLIGSNSASGAVTNVYATGWVSAAAPTINIGALAGGNAAPLANAYWNTETSGQTQAVGTDVPGSTIFAKTTAELQAALPPGFDTAVWGIVPGISYPYLNWRFPSGPTVVSGMASNIQGGDAGLVVGLAINGTFLGTQVTGANGYYHFMVDPQAVGGGALTFLNGAVFPSGSTPSYSNAVGDLQQLHPSFAQGHATGLNLNDDVVFVKAGPSLTTLSSIITLMGKAAGDITNPNYNNSIGYDVCGCSNLLFVPGSGPANMSFTLASSAASLILDAPLGIAGSLPNNIDIFASGPIIVDANVTAHHDILMTTPGDFTIDSGAKIKGRNVTLSAIGNFVNDQGSNAVSVSGGGRFLIYSADPSLDTFGGLDSGNTAIWNAAYTSLPPASVTQTGNRYLFAFQPTVTITADNKSKTYGDSIALTYSVSGLQPAVAGAYLADTQADAFSGTPLLSSPGAAAGANVAGSPYVITTGIGSVAALNGYQVALVNGALTVNARPITVTADALAKIYGNTDPALTFKVTSGNLVGSDTLGGALARAAGENVGAYAVNQGTLANANYLVSFVGNNLTITPRPITVSADALAKIYGNADPALTFKLTSGNLVGSDTLGGALARAAGENVGAYAVNQGTLANANYLVSFVGNNLTITPRPITVSADALAKIYGNADPALTFKLTSGNLVGSDTLGGALARAAGENVGAYAVNQGTLANANYQVAFVGNNLTITPRPITVSADALAKIYGNADPALTFKLTSGNLVGSDTLGGALARAAGENVGAYAINQGTLAASTNYTLTYVGNNLAITPRPITVSADALAKIYGNADPALTFKLTSGNLVGSDALGGALARAAGENVGAYAINQGTLAASTNYTLTYVGNNLAITPRPLTVTADALAKIYGNADPALTFKLTSGNLVGSDTLGGAPARAAGENVGAYAINQGTLANANYQIAYVGNNLTITPRPIMVTADALAKIYGNADPALTFKLTSGNLVGSDTLGGALARAAGENVGAYAINQGTLAASTNYTLTYVGNNLAITPRPLTVTADPKSKAEGTPDPALSFKITAGTLVGADAFGGLLIRAAGESAGAYPINQGSLTLGANYTLNYVGANLTITTAGGPTPPAFNLNDYFGSYVLAILTPAGWTIGGVPWEGPKVPPNDPNGLCGGATPLGDQCQGVPHPDNQSIGLWIKFVAQ